MAQEVNVEEKSVVTEEAKKSETVYARDTWKSYFPVRVTLTRHDVIRVIASLGDVESLFKKRSLNIDRELAQIAATLKLNIDSALKFNDSAFILITQDEYDTLTANQK